MQKVTFLILNNIVLTESILSGKVIFAVLRYLNKFYLHKAKKYICLWGYVLKQILG